MTEKKKYNPLSMLSDAHLSDSCCCSDNYLLDRSTMTCETTQEVANNENEKATEEK